MTKNLVIVESPAKARTIERYLGPGYRVLASYGHVRDLPENPGKNKLGVDVENDFAPEYVVSEDRKKQVAGHRQGGEGRRRGLPRHRPRPRGRGHRLARCRGGQRAARQDPARDLLGDHRRRDPRRFRTTRARSTTTSSTRSRRGASSIAWSATRSARCCGARSMPGFGRPRPVGRRAPGRRAGARDPRLHGARVLDDRGRPRDGPRRALRQRARPKIDGEALKAGEGGGLHIGDEETAERHAAALRDARPQSSSIDHDAPEQAPSRAAVHDLDAAAGGQPQARLQPQAHDAHRPGPVRGRSTSPRGASV